MLKWLWDGKMDCSCEDLSLLLQKNCKSFTETVLKTAPFSPTEESKSLINEECMQRFQSIVGILSKQISESRPYLHEDLFDNPQNAVKLNCWIILGTLTEATLQIFLAIYLDDYRNTKWQQWINFKDEQVRKLIIDNIQQLVNDGILEASHARSLKEAIKDTIKAHTREHDIQKIMFDELIQLFSKLELFDEDDMLYLRQIQSSRNGVHAFQNRKIGTWMDLLYCIRFFCYLLEWVLCSMPDISDLLHY